MKINYPYALAVVVGGALIVSGLAVDFGLSKALIGSGIVVVVSAMVVALEGANS